MGEQACRLSVQGVSETERFSKVFHNYRKPRICVGWVARTRPRGSISGLFIELRDSIYGLEPPPETIILECEEMWEHHRSAYGIMRLSQ